MEAPWCSVSDEFDLTQGGVKIFRAHGAVGPALRLELGDYVQLCVSGSLVFDYVDAEPAGMLNNAVARHDLRLGWRASPWIAIGYGPVELRIEGAARGFTSRPVYQIAGVVPSLAPLEFFDFDLLNGLGYRSAALRPHKESP